MAEAPAERRGTELSRLPMIRSAAAAVLFLLALAIPGGPLRAAASEWAREQHGAARLISAVEATGSSAVLDVGLQLRLTPGWHTYWRTPGDAGFPPSIDWKGSENVAGAEIAWPAPQRLPPLAGLETVGYEGGVVLPIGVRLAHPKELVHLHADVDYASCKDICIPYHAGLDLKLRPGLAIPGPEAPLIAAARARVPGDLAAARLRVLGAAVAPGKDGAMLSLRLASTGEPLRVPDLFVEGVASGSPGRPAVALTADGKVATIGVPIRGGVAAAIPGTNLRVTFVDGARAAEIAIMPSLGALAPIAGSTARITIIGLALLGGLILNLMPCVLPVLSLKLLALASYSGAARRAARIGLFATGTGVIVSFLVIAAALIVLKAAGSAIGWGIQFQQPWFLAGMALLTTLFAASLWDWLPFVLPDHITNAIGSVRGRGRLSGAFLMGAFATLLAASCSAPFVGTAIGFALARGPLDISFVFTALGIGMAAPFLAVAAAPGAVAYLPRPGPWMVWLRRGLGLALLGTAVWLLAVLALEASADVALLVGGTLGALLATLAWRHTLSPDRRAHLATGVAAIILAAITVVVPSLRGPAVPVDLAHPSKAAGRWQPFDEASAHRMVADGKVVLVDVTAAWCLTCKVNELAVLDRAPVAERLRSPDAATMRADWTRPNPTITAYLQIFGRYGVPLDVVYGPGAPEGIALPELLTSGAVMDALERAARHQEALR
jgi:suppressor for copper-sensitivity B